MTFVVFSCILNKCLTYVLRQTIAGWKNSRFGQFIFSGALLQPPASISTSRAPLVGMSPSYTSTTRSWELVRRSETILWSMRITHMELFFFDEKTIKRRQKRKGDIDNKEKESAMSSKDKDLSTPKKDKNVLSSRKHKESTSPRNKKYQYHQGKRTSQSCQGKSHSSNEKETS